MKKICIMFFSLLAILAISGCNKDKSEGQVNEKTDGQVSEKTDGHVCEFTDWIEVEVGNCYKKGIEEKRCQCGKTETRETDYVHNYVTVEALAATCTTSGHGEYQKCTNCNKEVGYQSIPATGHKETHWESDDEYYHTEYCGVCEQSTDNYREYHEFDEGQTTPATCTEDGKTVYTCTVCEYQKEEIISATGHTPGEVATCTTDQICTVCEEVLEEKTGHLAAYGACDEDVYCLLCDEKLEDAVGHVSSGDATCTTHEYCTNCFENINDPQHIFENNVCSVCGDLEPTDGLEYDLFFGTEYYYQVSGIEESVSYVVIPNLYKGLPVKSIEAEAFSGDQLLEKVFISSNVSFIGEGAFANCANLTTIFFEGTTKPSNVGSNWNGNAKLYYEGEYTLTGNVAVLSLEDTTGNQAYDMYISLLEQISNNYTALFEHEYIITQPGITMDFVGNMDLKVTADSVYAYEKLITSQNINYGGMVSNDSYTTETKEYYNDGYLYSHVIQIDSQSYNTKSYSTLPYTQVFDNCLTSDVVTPTRSEFAKAKLVADGNGIYRIILSTEYDYLASEISAMINNDKVALNDVDVTSILGIPGAVGSIVFTNNTNTGAFGVSLYLYGETDGNTITYSSYTEYSNVGYTSEQICPNKSDYVLHQHVGDYNTCEEVTCRACQNVVQEAKEHTFTTDDCESNTCTICGEVVETGKTHVYSDGQCLYCGVKQATSNLEFELNSDQQSYSLSGMGTCGSKKIIIPSYYEGLPVTGIKYNAFDGSKVTSVFIPETITSLENDVLGSCDTLETLIVENIDNIGKLYWAFSNAINIKEIIILGGTTIENDEFSNSTFESLETVILPETITSIGSNAFANCANIINITLPSSVETIEDNAFVNCTSLESIVIPEKVTTINNNTFSGCTSLKRVELPVGLVEIEWTAFDGCTSLESIVIPETVTSIGTSAFRGVNNLKEITINGDLFTSDAFAGCVQSLQKVTLTGENVANLAFDGATELETVILTEGIQTIGEQAFANCTKLTSITIPDSVTTIGRRAFENCTLLEEVVLSDNSQLEGIKEYAFYNCSLITEINLGEGFRYIYDNAFENCIGLTELTLPSTLTTLYSSAFAGCVNIKKITTACNIPLTTILPNLEEVIFSGTKVGMEALNSVTTLKKVVINETVTTIEEYAFMHCTSLEEVVLNEGLESINYRAFYDCQSLNNVILPSTLTSVDYDAFAGCTSLTDMYYNGTINDWCSVQLSESISTPIVHATRFNVKDENGEYYDVKAATELVFDENIANACFGQLYGINAVEKITIHSFDGSLGSLYGSGYSGNNSDYMPESLKEVVVTGETLYADLLEYCTYLETITISDTITNIERYALSGCSAIQKLTIPFVGIGENGSLESSLYYLFGSNLYYMPESLKEVVVTGGNINMYAFSDCPNIESITLPSDLIEIGESAFRYCEGLKTIEIPETVTTIYNYVFGGCTNLEEVELPEGLDTLGSYVFEDCTSLTSITIPKTLTSTGEGAFENCTSLENIYYNGTFEEWTNISFGQYGGNPIDYATNFYVLNNGQYETVSKLIIPETVTHIGSEYSGFKNVTEIVIPKTVTSISFGAFEGFENVEKITLPFVGFSATGTANTHLGYIFGTSSYSSNASYVPSSLKEVVLASTTAIGDNAFYGCSSIESITIPATVTSIGSAAFTGCSSLANVYYNGSVDDWCQISFVNAESNPKNVTEHLYFIDGEEYKEIEEIVISEGVEIVNDYAFANFSDVISITIPSTVTLFGDNAFVGCSSLANVYYNGTVETWANIVFETHKTGAYWQSGGLECGSTPTLFASHIYFLDGEEYKEVEEIVIPEGVTTINNFQFVNFSNVKTIVIPSSVTAIGEFAFKGASSVESLTLPFLGDSLESSTANLGYIFGTEYYTSHANIIPTTLKEVVVTLETEITYGAFCNCSSLQSVTLPSTVTSIGNCAFENCSSLQTVIFEGESQLTTLGTSAFANCTSLSNINLPSNVTTIGESSFDNCSALTNITIPANVTTISKNAFYNCSLLETVTFSEGSLLDSIGQSAFENCSALSNINLEDCSVLNSFAQYAFNECTSLKNVVLPNSVTIINANVFTGCSSMESLSIPFVGSLADGTGKTFIGHLFGASYYSANNSVVPTTLTSVTITSGTTVPANAFNGCKSIESVTFAEGCQLESIGNYAFNGCSALLSIKLPLSLKTISEYAFQDCTGLTTIEIPANVTYIGNYAFDSCNLETVTFEEGSLLESIGRTAFYSCTSLANINLEDCTSLTTIDQQAFEGCTLLESITIPASVTTISTEAFANCTSLKSITFGTSLTSIASCAFNSCSSLTNVYYNGTIADWVNISFADGAANPMCYASNIYMLDENGTVEHNGNKYSVLTSLEIPYSVTTIGQYQFYNFGTLENVILPGSLISAGTNAFNGCTITNMYFNGTISDWLSLSFSNSSSNFMTLATNFYMLNENGDVEYNGNKYSVLIEVEIPDTVTAIGKYAFYNCKTITSVKISANVESLGSYAFNGCSSLATVEFAEESKLTSIDSYAFYECSKLTSFTIPTGVTTIGEKAFYNCSKMESLVIPTSVETIYSNAFYGWRALTSLEFAEGSTLKTIGNSAFAQCTALTSVVIPNSVTRMGNSVFYACNALENVTLSTGITAIYNDTFSGCNLTSIVIPTGVTSIGERAFFTCNLMEYVVMPSTVTSVGYSAFYGCNALENVYFTGTQAQWNSITKAGNNTLLTSATITYDYVA